MSKDTSQTTTKASHTPGPWHTATAARLDNVGGRDVAVVDQANYIIAEAFEIVGHGEHRSAEANARLIAAAPDLLEAATKVNNILAALQHACDDGNGTYEDLYAMCKQLFSDGAAMSLCKAIAKARGQ